MTDGQIIDEPIQNDAQGSHSNSLSGRGNYRQELVILLVVAALVRLFWLFLIPLSEAPDEPNHIWVAQFLAEHLRLPHVKDVLDAGYAAVYGPMPQMGYLVQALTGKIFSVAGAPYCFRLGSLIMGLISILAAYLTGKELFPTERVFRLSLPLFMAFHPQLVFVQICTNNDSTASGLGAAITFIAVRFIKRGLSLPYAALVGLLLGWLALSKYSAYSLFLGVAYALVIGALLHRTSLLLFMKAALIAGACCAGSCGWWFLRQLHEYPGDLLGNKTEHEIWMTLRHVPKLHFDFWQVLQTPIYWQIMLKSYLGVFGYMKRYLWEQVYLVYGLFAIIGTIGGAREIALLLLKLFSKGPGVNQAGVENDSNRRLKESAAVVGLFVICVVPTLAAITYAAVNNIPVQGRYLTSVESSIILLFIFGFRPLGLRVANVCLISLLIFNFSVFVGASVMLCRLYGFLFITAN